MKEITFPAKQYRSDFPILTQEVHGKPLVYLDNAATTQKPKCVIDAINHYYANDNANVHRGIHMLSERATAHYESARETVQRFINAREAREIIFVRGTTEAINLVAFSFGRQSFGAGDEILITGLEHHSNIVPWQLIAEQTGAKLCVVDVNEAGEVDLIDFHKKLSDRCKLVAFAHISNALGTINPIKEMISAAHEKNIPVLVDGAQAIAHTRVDVQALDCDFYAFSGHKAFGPTGIGVLYGKADLLERMPPFQGGGEMIRHVTFAKTSYNKIPHRFEAGTPNIAGATGLAAALNYLETLDWPAMQAYEDALLDYAQAALSEFPGVRIIGTAKQKTSIVSFVMDTIHAHDIGTILDRHGVAVRSGHHCAMPLMDRFGLAATTRLSLAFYNTKEDLDAFLAALNKVREVFAG